MKPSEHTVNPDEDELLRRARRRVKQKIGFYVHATVYLLVNLGLALIGLWDGGRSWPLWPIAGWGLALAIHGLVTYTRLRGEGLGERMLQQELQRLKQGQDR